MDKLVFYAHRTPDLSDVAQFETVLHLDAPPHAFESLVRANLLRRLEALVIADVSVGVISSEVATLLNLNVRAQYGGQSLRLPNGVSVHSVGRATLPVAIFVADNSSTLQTSVDITDDGGAWPSGVTRHFSVHVLPKGTKYDTIVLPKHLCDMMQNRPLLNDECAKRVCAREGIAAIKMVAMRRSERLKSL